MPPTTLAALLGVLAMTAALAGCSGGPDLSGDWTFAVGIEDGAATGVVSLTQDDEGQLNGSGELCSEEDCFPASATGSLSEQGETVVLEMAEGSVRLQGDVAEDRLSGEAIVSTAEEPGTFAAARVSEDAPEAGSEEQSEQVRAALSDYYKAFGYDGYNRQEYISSISGVVVEPVFWSSPAGNTVEDAEPTSNDAWSADYELEEFVSQDQRAGEATGMARYTTEYDLGDDSGTRQFANELTVVRWGDGWKVLWADEAFLDLSAYDLSGTWEGEFSEAPPETATQFTLDLDQTTAEDLRSAQLSGTLTTTVYGEEQVGELNDSTGLSAANVGATSSVEGDGSVDVFAGIQSGGFVDIGQYNLTGNFNDARSLEGNALVQTCDGESIFSCETVETTFTAQKVD